MEEERQREGEVNAGTGEEKGESLGGRFKGASRNSEFTRRLFSLLSLPPPPFPPPASPSSLLSLSTPESW